jgi:hypothetical protein
MTQFDHNKPELHTLEGSLNYIISVIHLFHHNIHTKEYLSHK